MSSFTRRTQAPGRRLLVQSRAFPERARPGFVGLRILTLDEMLDIAEGGANKPGLYLETKVPAQFPGIEDDLRKLLERRGWLQPRERAAAGHVDVAHGNGRVILQTFEKSSLELLQESMPQVPKILLLWLGDGYLEARSPVTFKESGETDKAAFYARQEVKSEAEFGAWLDWAKAHGALGTGPLGDPQRTRRTELRRPGETLDEPHDPRARVVHPCLLGGLGGRLQGPRRGRRRRFLHQPHLGTAEVPGPPGGARHGRAAAPARLLSLGLAGG